MKRYFLFLLFLALPVPLAGQDRKYEYALVALDDLIAREVKDKNIPGLSIALVDDQTVVWSKGYGYQDAEKKTPATSKTVYRVGSVSKPISALLLMILV